MSSVSADPTGRKPYHHGALHSALIEASIALAREGGPDRVILREAARAAGVSHSAAYRHFADRDALLAEVSRFARNELGAEMRRRVNRTRDPAAGCERSAPPTSTSHSPSPDCFAPRSPHIPLHPATQRTIDRPEARTQHTAPPSPTPTRSLVKYSTKPKLPVYWILAAGREQRLPPGQRSTALPACCSTGRYPLAPQPSNSREGTCWTSSSADC